MSSRKSELDEYIKKLRVVHDSLQSLRRHQEETIETLSWLNRVIERNLVDVEFLLDLYGSVEEDALQQASSRQYEAWVLPLQNAISYGYGFVAIGGEIPNAKDYIDRMIPAASAGSTVFAATTSASTMGYMAIGEPASPNKEKLRRMLSKYLGEMKVEEEVSYIAGRLEKSNPNVSDDFRHFLTNFYASGNGEVKYQELVGFRSLFFIKLIDGFAAGHGADSSTSRKKRILMFLCADIETKAKDLTALADSAMSLWNELSSQDASRLSAKLGNVTSDYVRLLFNEAIILAGALLKQNELNWK